RMNVFFFSSRRRHTRFSRDWSSDVCSSDLENAIVYDEKISNANMVKNQRARWINAYRLSLKDSAKLLLKGIKSLNLNMFIGGVRSEERRVGKECRARWWR